MRFRIGKKYQHRVHGLNCHCHSPEALNFLDRMEKGLSRRSVLRGIAATLAALALGTVSPGFSQEASKPILLKNARIFDGRSAQPIDGENLLIIGDRIAGLPGENETVSDAEIIDYGVRSIEHGQSADEKAARQTADAGAWWSIQPFLADEDANVYPTAELLATSGPRNPYAGKLGVIEADAYADVLLVDGNPLEDINLVADPDTNMTLALKSGRIHKNTLGA